VVSELDLQEASPPELTDLYSHFRLVYVTPGETKAIYEPVSGAVLRGNTTPNAQVGVETDVSVPNYEFTYRQQATSNASGYYRIRVAYPGEYTLPDGSTATVTASNVTLSSSAISIWTDPLIWYSPFWCGKRSIDTCPDPGRGSRLVSLQPASKMSERNANTTNLRPMDDDFMNLPCQLPPRTTPRC
jgi:hypothetical protein